MIWNHKGCLLKWFIIGLMAFPANSKNQFTFTNLKFHKKDHGMPADWNFFTTSHCKGGNDGAGGDVKNSVWWKVLQGKSAVGDLELFFTLAKSKYPEFIIEGFKTAEICEATKYLAKQYEKHSKKLPNSIKYYCIAIENEKVVGHMLNKTCSCHYQLGKDQEEQSNISQSDNPISSQLSLFRCQGWGNSPMFNYNVFQKWLGGTSVHIFETN